jgi:hypothetical protein
MSTPIEFSQDRERNRRLWNQYLADIDAEIREEQASKATFTTDIGKAIETPLVIKPGSQHARAAAEAWREDEYSNRMKARYGGEW